MMKKRTLVACLLMGALLVPSMAQAETAFFPDPTGTQPIHTETNPQSIHIEKLDANAEVVKDNDEKDAGQAEDQKVLKKVTLTIGSTTFHMCKTVCGEEGTMDVAPMIKDNRTFIPLRAVSEALGATVDFVEATDETPATITVVKGETTIVMTPDVTTYTVNGEEKTLDAAPFIEGDRTMVPIRFIAEGFGYEVEAIANDAGLTDKVVIYVQPKEEEPAVDEKQPAVEEEQPAVEEGDKADADKADADKADADKAEGDKADGENAEAPADGE